MKGELPDEMDPEGVGADRHYIGGIDFSLGLDRGENSTFFQWTNQCFPLRSFTKLDWFCLIAGESERTRFNLLDADLQSILDRDSKDRWIHEN